jgi:molybdate transport system substrate-binding protein
MRTATKPIIAIAAAFLLAVGLGGCAGGKYRPAATAPAEKGAGEITIAAAADLRTALTDVSRVFEERSGTKVKLVFGSSGLLAAQIENGAPFDVFASADRRFIVQLADRGLIADSGPYLKGMPVIIGRAASLSDLKSASVQKIAIANPKHAPYGLAAKEALISAGLWDELEHKLVYGENALHAMEFVETGNADAAIVPLALAKPAGIDYASIGEGLHRPIEQWIGLLNQESDRAAAKEFYRFLLTDEIKEMVMSYGFEPLKERPVK